MAILTLPPFTPANPWVRPSTPEAWQAELGDLKKRNIPLQPVGGNPVVLPFSIGAGLLLGYLIGMAIGLAHGTFMPALCVAPFMVVLILVSLGAAWGEHDAVRQFMTRPDNQRRLALSEAPDGYYQGAISRVPAAYLEYLALGKTSVPLLMGDVYDICQRHGIFMHDDGPLSSEWFPGIMLLLTLAGLVAMVLGGLASLP
jgi:hypothetical protein